MPQKVEISSKTIVFTVSFILLLGVIWLIKDLIFSLFIAFIIAGALRQPVNYLEKKKIPRSLASIVIYFIFIFVIFYLFALIIPPLVGEIIVLFKNLPNIISKVFPNASSIFNFNFLSNNIPSLANETISLIRSAFSNVIFITSTLFFGFYFLLEKNLAQRLLGNFFDDIELDRINLISERAQQRMAGWFWGEIILMIAVGLLTYIGLSFMGIKYALALAVLSGLLEIVPNLGPITATVPAFFIGLSQSYFLGLSMIGLYLIVQQLENNLIVPIVMKKAVGIHPIITLIALVIGGKLAGIMGVLLAIPTTIFIETILIESQKIPKK
ncbi:MAG: AI-2E family transporter [Patescibacteria group bacterium]